MSDPRQARAPGERISAAAQMLRRHPVAPGPKWAPLPPPAAPPPYRRKLADVLPADRLQRIGQARALRFHCVGDTGGWREPEPQRDVAAVMAAELGSDAPVDFFYHLGDVVYPHGEQVHYRAQFFAPYAAYRAPIFAIPGNHDAEAPVDIENGTGSLQPFLRTFSAPTPPLHDAALQPRPAVRQPHVHWTLVHDWLWMVGLYTNVHEDGEIDEAQLEWLTGELHDAPNDVTLILTAHRPVYSADVVHGSNLELGDALDRCFARAGRVPDAVFGAHAHNYQRFTRRLEGRRIPYIVAGAGGFHQRHPIGDGAITPMTLNELPEVTLERFDFSSHGFLTVTITPGGAEAEYRVVTASGTAAVDRFTFGGRAT